MAEMSFFSGFLSDFHFLRPWWLVALLLLVPLHFALRKQQNLGGAWGKVCDAHLLSALLVKGEGKGRGVLVKALFAAFALAIVAAAGPAWQKLPQMSVKGGANTVFVLDMGLAMGANDVKPSRLERAKFKMYDILRKVGGDQAALVLFDDEGYTVSPLSQDMKVIENIIPTLELDVMPGNGYDSLAKGIDEATSLLEKAGLGGGRIIVLTGAGEADALAAKTAAKRAAAKGNVVSVLAIGTKAGAPAPNPAGGFYADKNGKTVMFKTALDDLKDVASAGKGGFSVLTADEKDIEKVLVSPLAMAKQFENTGLKADTWRDMGIYLVFVVLVPVLFAFKRGFIAVLFFAVFLSGGVREAKADWWDSLWLNHAQQAEKNMKVKDYKAAAKNYDDPAFKGYAYYRAKDYKNAASELAKKKDETSLYNMGNAKAFAGDIKGAIEAYEAAIKLNAKHEDAIFNRDYLKQQQEKQQQQQEKQEQDKQDNQEQDKQEEQEQQQDKQQQQQQDKQQQQQEQQDEQERQGESGTASEQKPLSEEEQADKQWVNRIEEDKGGLIRARLRKIYKEKSK